VEPVWWGVVEPGWYIPALCESCEQARERRRKEREAARRLRERLKASNLPPEAEGWNFDKAEAQARQLLSPADFESWRKAAMVCRTWPPTSRRGLYLKGRTGRGKTILAYCILESAIRSFGLTGLFVAVGQLFEDTKLTWNRDLRAKDLVNRARVVDLLVLDELGAEPLRPWMQKVIFGVLDHRIKHKKPSIITTNCGLEEMDEILGDPHERVMSRIMGNFTGVKVCGADFRCLGADDWWAVW